MNEPKETEELIRCEYCDKETNELDLHSPASLTHQLLPNTFTDMDDRGTVLWRCPHCGCWQ